MIVVPDQGKAGTIRVRVFAEDFPAGRDPAAIGRYLGERLRLIRDGRVIPLVLTHEAVDGDTQRLELRFTSAGCSGLTVWNGVLTERFPDQVNLVQVQCGRRVHQLLFSPGEGPKRL